MLDKVLSVFAKGNLFGFGTPTPSNIPSESSPPLKVAEKPEEAPKIEEAMTPSLQMTKRRAPARTMMVTNEERE